MLMCRCGRGKKRVWLSGGGLMIDLCPYRQFFLSEGESAGHDFWPVDFLTIAI